jgi:hypothetical protein
MFIICKVQKENSKIFAKNKAVIFELNGFIKGI